MSNWPVDRSDDAQHDWKRERDSGSLPDDDGRPIWDEPIPENDRRILGILSLCFGIASFLVGPFVLGATSVAGVILGSISLFKEPRARMLAMFGLVLSALGFFFMVFVFFAALIFPGASVLWF